MALDEEAYKALSKDQRRHRKLELIQMATDLCRVPSANPVKTKILLSTFICLHMRNQEYRILTQLASILHLQFEQADHATLYALTFLQIPLASSMILPV